MALRSIMGDGPGLFVALVGLVLWVLLTCLLLRCCGKPNVRGNRRHYPALQQP